VPEAVEMTGGWKVEENQKQVSLHFPPALEIAIAIPTFPPPRTRLYSWKGESKTKGPTTLSSGSFFNENMLLRFQVNVSDTLNTTPQGHV
jgi:hypothetical protein